VSVHFMFSAHPLRRGAPDPLFEAQKVALEAAGFTASCIGEETFKDCRPVRGVPRDSTVVYRGWMVSPKAFQNMVEAVNVCGARMLTSQTEYLLTHYLPNWYPILSDLTPETKIYPENTDLVAELEKLGWEAFFLKDYVKSLKIPPGAIVYNPGDASSVVSAMRDYRGEIEGGLCVRKVEDFVAQSERRYFVLNGAVFGCLPIPDIAREVARRIQCKFYSIDVIARRDGVLRVVEVGDGQVSDLVGWEIEQFVDMWNRSGMSAG